MAMLTLKASGTFVRVAADGYAVAAVSQHLPDPEAYARAFAAAPDLLAVLTEAKAALEYAARGADVVTSDKLAVTIGKINAALAKATGAA